MSRNTRADDRAAVAAAFRGACSLFHVEIVEEDDGSIDPWSPYVIARFAGAEFIFVSRREAWVRVIDDTAEVSGATGIGWASKMVNRALAEMHQINEQRA
jgi:hypothetical protein